MQNLDELISTYAENKRELDAYKKICEQENAEIKAAMESLGVDTYKSDTYTVKYVPQNRESLNEEKVLQAAHLYNVAGIIKTREYVDMDALEGLLYDGGLPEDFLAEISKAREVKTVVTLRISQNKKG